MAANKTRSCIAAAISLCGLLIALLLNFAFLRAYAGFFAGCVCFVAAAVAQLIFKNQAELAVGDEDIPESELGEYRFAVVRTAQAVFGLDFTLLCAGVPLLFAGASSHGLLFGAFFTLALCRGVPAAIVFSLGAQWLNCSRISRGLWALGDGVKNRYVGLFRLRRGCVLALCALLAASAFICAALTDSAIEAARIRAVAINNVFVGVYALEIVSIAAFYIVKRSKIR